MKVGDVYYEKHTVVDISKRTGTISETDVEIVDVLPIDVLDKIKAEIKETYMNITYQENKDRKATWGLRKALEIIDKYKTESEAQATEIWVEARVCAESGGEE